MFITTYNFSWDQLGDIESGRPNLGNLTSVAVYRLMQYTMREVLEKEFGDERTRSILVNAGRLAGSEFCRNVLDTSLPVNKFLAQLNRKITDFSIGILRFEKSDPEKMDFVLTISEDLDCSGLPVKGVTVCEYDEGFLEGIFSVYANKEFSVQEVDCWSTGERTCRFIVKVKE